jgi:hypothetical protein
LFDSEVNGRQRIEAFVQEPETIVAVLSRITMTMAALMRLPHSS